MDMRTVEKIEYGSASAVRVPPDAISNLGMPDRFIAFDTETTGLNPDKDCIVELGAVVFEHGVPIETFQSYVNPCVCISEEVSALNHITNEMLQAAPTEEIIYDYLQSTTSIGAMHRMGVGECHTCFTGFVYKPVPEIRNFR